MRSFKTRELAVCATCVALSVALNQLTLFKMPQGGAVTPCSMLFIALSGYWFGPFAGVTSGVAMGLLDLLLGGYVVHPAQLLLDYPLAFGMLGLAGAFRKMRFGLPVGYMFGAAGRFAFSFLSGWVFFAEYAPEGQHAAAYSAVYNGSYIGAEVAVTLALLCVPVFRDALERIGTRFRRV